MLYVCRGIVGAGGLTRSTSASLTPKICSSAPGWAWLACQGLRGTNAFSEKAALPWGFTLQIRAARIQGHPTCSISAGSATTKAIFSLRQWNTVVGHPNLLVASHLKNTHFNWNGQAKGSIPLHTYRETSGNLLATKRWKLNIYINNIDIYIYIIKWYK